MSSDPLSSIVPVLKVVDTTGSRPIELNAQDLPIVRPFVSDFIILYAEDKPTHFEFVSRRRLTGLGITEDELHVCALANLPKRPPKIELHGSPPKQMLVAGGNFEATLLLYDDLWKEISKTTNGEVLAVAPARDLVFISDSAWDGARGFLTEVANKELLDQSHMLSKRILRRSSGRWVPDDLSA